MRRWSGRVRALVATVAAALLASGCIGAVSRGAFEREIDARGGGISSGLLADAISAIETELGVDDIETDGIYMSSQLVNMDVRSPADPDAMDSYSYHLGSLDDPEPVQIYATDPPIEQRVFAVSEVPVAELDTLIAIALNELDIPGAVPQSVSISRRGFEGGPVEITIGADSERASGSAVFDADGALIEVRRS